MSSAADLLLESLGRGFSALAEAADPDLPELLHDSDGRRLAVLVRGTNRVLEVEVKDGALRVLAPRRLGEPGEAEAEGLADGADLVLSGSVPDFLRFVRGVRRDSVPVDVFGELEVHGDPEAREGFVALLRRLDPDWEALLARAAGGVVAHAVARTTIGRLYQARKSAARLVDDLAEYVDEESRLVPDPPDRRRFADGVESLSDKVAELEERLDRVR